MAEVLKIFDGGVINEKGRHVGVIHFLISTDEGTPETLLRYCQPNYRDSIIKNLRRLAWKKPARSQEQPGDDAARFIAGVASKEGPPA